MRKLAILLFLSTFILADDLNILNKDKKELRKLEKQILEQNYETLKNDWISTLDLNSSLNRSRTFNDKSDDFTKSVSLGFSQSIYESGGIEFTIKYADDKFRSDLLAWENENKQILQNVYKILLGIKKLYIQLEQSDYQYKNKEIELILKKIQYENGQSDITELNDAIMAKNDQYKEYINLENSIKEQKAELAKYTSLKYEQIELIDFANVTKEDYLKKNIDILYEDSLVTLADTSYKKLRTDYLPKISVSTSLSYSDKEDLQNDTEDYSKSGALSLNLSFPLYDINKKPALEKSRLEYLKQKISLNDLREELEKDFDEALTRVETYKKYNRIIKENINLYDDLIEVNKISNEAGITPGYDLEILKNTKKINAYDLAINDINIQIEYADLYFKIKAGE